MCFNIIYNGKRMWFYYKMIVFLYYCEFVTIAGNILLIKILCMCLCEIE